MEKLTSLGEAQRLFPVLLTRLLLHIYEQGYEVTLGDAYRDPRAFGSQGQAGPYGERKSAHKQRLAIDLNLFKDGDYLPHTESHSQFGAFWKTLHPECVWGGAFGDGNHYSLRFQGIA